MIKKMIQIAFHQPLRSSITEEIDDDLEQHNEITSENEGPHQQPEEISETVHTTSVRIRLSIARSVRSDITL